jgi:hypothetical protein
VKLAEKKLIMKEVSEVFGRHHLVLEESKEVCEAVLVNLVTAKYARVEASGVPMNRKTRRGLNL